MCKPSWRALGLLLVFLFSFAAAQQMSPEALEKYIEKKLRRNHHTLRLNEKIIGDQGAVLLARSPLMKSVRVDRKSTRLNSSHTDISRMPSSA